jgi:hypothetical protein
MLTLFCASAASAQETTVQQQMPFDSCVENQQTSAAGAVPPPLTTVDTTEVREVQFSVPDGQVTITCTRADGLATITHR